MPLRMMTARVDIYSQTPLHWSSKCYIANLPIEMLETILLALPLKDLLLSQRVTGLWRDLIKASKKLQQALFLLPEDVGTSWRHELVCYLPKPGNEVQQEAWRCFPWGDSQVLRQLTATRVPSDFRLASEGPNMWIFDDPQYHRPGLEFRASVHTIKTAGEPHPAFEQPHPAFDFELVSSSNVFNMLHSHLRPEASWKRMYPCQPPVKALGVMWYGTWIEITRTKPITIGDIVDASKDWKEKDPHTAPRMRIRIDSRFRLTPQEAQHDKLLYGPGGKLFSEKDWEEQCRLRE